MQSKRQGTTFMVIPCLYSFLLTVLRTLAAEPPINKKRTRTLFHKESGSYDLGRHSYGSRNRGLSNSPTGLLLTLPTGVVRAALFEFCTAHHKQKNPQTIV